jgi:hypothetical protein
MYNINAQFAIEKIYKVTKYTHNQVHSKKAK